MGADMERVIEVTKNGEIEISQKILQRLGLAPKDRLVLIGRPGYLLLKRIEEEPLEERFERLSAEVRRSLRKRGVRKDDLVEAIRWTRKRE